ncbi:MAG: ORF6N domain-containing protein, partial [Deltaproteobacteria bacterium]|nr:ORF6N domain-containing protein [Deltaproteobacteria bacterium]
MLKKSQELVPENQILKIILIIRGEKVILDSDLAALYGVETRRLNEQVRRNIEKFPEDFMFQLTQEEFTNLKSQIATSSIGWGGRRKAPLVFSEHGALQAAN